MPTQIARNSDPQPPILLRENAGSIAVLTLNRPASRNSLSEGLIAELRGFLENGARIVNVHSHKIHKQKQ